MFLQVQTVLQAQRQKLLLAQFIADASLHLVTKLGNPLAHQRMVVVVVLIHPATSSATRMAGSRGADYGLARRKQNRLRSAMKIRSRYRETALQQLQQSGTARRLIRDQHA